MGVVCSKQTNKQTTAKGHSSTYSGPANTRWMDAIQKNLIHFSYTCAAWRDRYN